MSFKRLNRTIKQVRPSCKLLACTQEVTSLYLGLDIKYSEISLAFPSVPGKFEDSILNYAPHTLFHDFPKSLFNNHPII
jgi:hypothetical protein